MLIDIACSSRELFGADRSALRLASVFRALGHRPTLLLPAHRPERGLAEEAARRGILVEEERIAIASSGGLEQPGARLGRGRRRPDVLVYGTTAVLDVPSRPRRKIVMVREWLDPRDVRHRALVARHRIGASAVVAVSSGALAQWRRVAPVQVRGYVVHNWLEERAITEPNERNGLLFLGRFNEWKGQEWLADAYDIAFDGLVLRPALRFVGAQEDPQFRDSAEVLRQRGADGRWSVEPFTRDPTPALAASAAVVIPSLKPEPFGNVILEALRAGCRVIAFPGGGPDDLLPYFPGALTTVPRTREDLARGLRKWWAEGGRAQSADERVSTRTSLRNHFSEEAAVRAWQGILSDLNLGHST